EGVDPDTASVIANAIYLKATWLEPFEPADTRQEPFQLADGSTIEAPMMRPRRGAFRYASGPGWQAVELPYAGSELVMWLLVPDRDQRPDHLLTCWRRARPAPRPPRGLRRRLRLRPPTLLVGPARAG